MTSFAFEIVDVEEATPEAPIYEKPDREGLVYCDFCKEYYNEYHFGRELEDGSSDSD